MFDKIPAELVLIIASYLILPDIKNLRLAAQCLRNVIQIESFPRIQNVLKPDNTKITISMDSVCYFVLSTDPFLSGDCCKAFASTWSMEFEELHDYLRKKGWVDVNDQKSVTSFLWKLYHAKAIRTMNSFVSFYVQIIGNDKFGCILNDLFSNGKTPTLEDLFVDARRLMWNLFYMWSQVSEECRQQSLLWKTAFYTNYVCPKLNRPAEIGEFLTEKRFLKHVKKDDVNMVSKFIVAGVDSDSQINDWDGALGVALIYRSQKTIEILLQTKPVMNRLTIYTTALLRRCAMSFPEYCFQLVGLGANVNQTDNVWDKTAIFWLAQDDMLDMGKKMIHLGAVIKREHGLKDSLLVHSVINNSYVWVDFLLKQGVDPNEPSQPGYRAITYVQTVEMAQLLVDAGADTEYYLPHHTRDHKCFNHLSLLKQALMIKNPDLVEYALSKKYNVNQQNLEGGTHLHRAVEIDDPKILKMLLNVPGIDVTIRNNVGYNPYQYAIKTSKIRMAHMIKQFLPIAIRKPKRRRRKIQRFVSFFKI